MSEEDKLLMTPVSILAAYIIETLGKMTDASDKSEWPLYKTSMPTGDNVEINCGALYNTTGMNESRLMTGLVVTHPGIQLRIRSSTSEIGWVKIEDIADALDKVENVDIVVKGKTYRIQNASRTSPIVPLGQEIGTRRYLFTVNYLLTVRRIAG